MRLTEEECQIELNFLVKELSLTVIKPLEYDYDGRGYQCIVRDEKLVGWEEMESVVDEYCLEIGTAFTNCYDEETGQLYGYNLQFFN